MVCTFCSYELNNNEKFCPSCGNEIIKISYHQFCSNCGTKNNQLRYCSECGNDLEIILDNEEIKVDTSENTQLKKDESEDRNRDIQYIFDGNSNLSEGLYSFKQLIQHFEDGKVSGSDLVKRVNSEKWIWIKDLTKENSYNLNLDNSLDLRDTTTTGKPLPKQKEKLPSLNGFQYFIYAISQYFSFNGRASRKEFWYYQLFYTLFATVALVLSFEVDALITFYVAILAFPSLAVSIRRLHDINKSGWMVLINVIPIIGPIWFIVLMLSDSEDILNFYGDIPPYRRTGL